VYTSILHPQGQTGTTIITPDTKLITEIIPLR